MQMRKRHILTLALSVGLAGLSFAQDSTGLAGTDAVSPWLTNEPFNSYVVNLTSIRSSWGQRFAMAPILKSSLANSVNPNALFSAQGISNLHARNVPFFLNRDTNNDGRPDRSTFDFWSEPGFGVNDDQSVNRPGQRQDLTSQNSNQFAIIASEFATTDAAQSYNAILGAVVNYAPGNPNQLYVSRVAAALNSFDLASNLSQFGAGAVDERGNLIFRADDFGVSNSGGLNALREDNIFTVDLRQRRTNRLNVVSDDFPGGQFDAPSMKWIVRRSITTHNTPTLIPESISGVVGSFYIGSNFNREYVRGADFGSVTADQSHLAGGVTEHRGSLAHSSINFSFLGSTQGSAAIIGRDGGANDKIINLFGIGANGVVTGREGVVLPNVVTDNATGFQNLPGNNELTHYFSQTAFRGGNGQIAIGRDQQGRALLAAAVDHPDQGATQDKQYIAVARRNGDGSWSWTMAGYNDGTSGSAGTGKPVLDGPSGNVIGRMVPLNVVTGGAPFGPSVSAPMIDSVGNVYFLTALELFEPATVCVGLVRAVYDPSNFSYRLELVMRTGGVYKSEGTGLNYRVTFMEIADSNSVGSGTAFSGNMTGVARGAADPSGFQPRDPRTLGGMVIAANIIYDVNQDDIFDADSGDQAYRSLLYIAGDADAEPEVITPTSYRASRGQELGTNDVAKIQNNDDVFATIEQRFQFAPTLANAELTAILTVPNPGQVTGAELSTTLRSNALPFGDASCRQEIGLFNWNTNSVEVVDTRKPTLSKQTITVTLDAAQRARFINQTTGEVRVLNRVFHLAPLSPAWRMETDQIKLTITR
jgi:hypothetical protein